MTVHRFTLIVQGPDLQAENCVDALFDAGCDDAAVGRVAGTQYLDFDREAESLADAVFEATRAIESAVPGACVVQVEPDDLVTMADIARRTGRTRESVRLLVRGQRGPGGFPSPATHFRTRNRMWHWQDAAAWFATVFGDSDETDSAVTSFIAAFNAGLRLRRAESALEDSERQRIRELVG